MAFELEIDSVLVPAKKWSGPGQLRSGYRGVEPGSHEAGSCGFTYYGTELRKPNPSLALSFDGVDDYVEIENSAGAALTAICTIAFWMRRKTIGGSGSKIVMGKGDISSASPFSIRRSSSNLFYFAQPTGVILTTTVAFTLVDTDWHCVICRNSGTSANVWVDNAINGSPDATPTTGTLVVNDKPITLGCGLNLSTGLPENFADIELDEVLYLNNRCWTDGECSNFWNSGRGRYMAAEGQQLFGFHCDGASGERLFDYSGENRHGIIYGASRIQSNYAKQADDDVLDDGREVVIRRNGKVRYRGIITGLDKDLNRNRDTVIETAESGARMNQLDAGMAAVEGLPNAKLYVYARDITIDSFIISGADGTDFPLSINGFGIRTEDSFNGPPPYVDSDGTLLTKAMIFDSYEYGPPRYPAIVPYQMRGLLWREESVTRILERVVELVNLQSGPKITDVQIHAGSGDLKQLYVTDDDRHIGGGPTTSGFITRELNGGIGTFFWNYRDGFLRLYQLVNHSRAILLGKIVVDSANFSGRNWRPILKGSYGPFEVPYQTDKPNVLAFYVAGVLRDDQGLQQNARIYEVNLNHPRGQTEDGLLNYTWQDIRATYADYHRRYVWGSNRNYDFSDVAHSERMLVARRTGGRYQLSDTYAVIWIGDTLLSEMAFDFQGAKLGDVLREVALVTGCEWWIDADGVLRLERMDRAQRTATVTARKVVRDRWRESLDAEKFEDFASSGIPLGKYGQAMMQIELQRLSALAGGKTIREMEILPQGEPDYSLGAMTTVNGERVGRLTAIEHGQTMDKLELMPMAERKPTKK